MLRFQDLFYNITPQISKLLQSPKDISVIPINEYENSQHWISFTAKYAVKYPNKCVRDVSHLVHVAVSPVESRCYFNNNKAYEENYVNNNDLSAPLNGAFTLPSKLNCPFECPWRRVCLFICCSKGSSNGLLPFPRSFVIRLYLNIISWFRNEYGGSWVKLTAVSLCLN
jgi:hypothetical protein